MIGHEELVILDPDVAERQVTQGFRRTLNSVCVGIRLEKNQIEFSSKDPLQHILDEIERLAKGLKEIGNKI